MDDSEVLMTFRNAMSGLQQEIAAGYPELWNNDVDSEKFPKKFDEVKSKYAAWFENLNKSSSSSQQQTGGSRVEEENLQLKALLTKSQSENNSLKSQLSRGSSNASSQKKQRTNEVLGENSATMFYQKQCFRCGRYGHFGNNCTDPNAPTCFCETCNMVTGTHMTDFHEQYMALLKSRQEREASKGANSGGRGPSRGGGGRGGGGRGPPSGGRGRGGQGYQGGRGGGQGGRGPGNYGNRSFSAVCRMAQPQVFYEMGFPGEVIAAASTPPMKPFREAPGTKRFNFVSI